jgi:hypothetical protein
MSGQKAIELNYNHPRKDSIVGYLNLIGCSNLLGCEICCCILTGCSNLLGIKSLCIEKSKVSTKNSRTKKRKILWDYLHLLGKAKMKKEH